MKLLLTLAFGLLTLPACAQTPPRYSVIDLGTLGGFYSQASAINNRGEIVGVSGTARKTKHTTSYRFISHAFLWQKGKMRDLGSLGGDNSTALALNDRGDVVGYSELPNTESYQSHSQIWLLHAFLYTNGKMRDLGTLPGDIVSIANGINAEGQVVGTSGTGATDKSGVLAQGAVLWSHGHVRLIDPSHSPTEANGISRYGQVAGKALTENFHPVVWSVWNLTTKSETDLAIDAVLGEARAVNSRGQVVGDRSDNRGNGRHAFLLDDDLPLLPGYTASDADAINNLGAVVGIAAVDANTLSDAERNHSSRGGAVACLWQDGRVLDLNMSILAGSGWTLCEATGINDKGWIVGNGNYQGKQRGFLLTPITK